VNFSSIDFIAKDQRIYSEKIIQIMSISFSLDNVRQPTRWVQIAFLTIAVLFNLCLVIQVLTVGLAYFYNPDWWKIHVWLVRGYGGLSLILLVLVFFSSFPRRVRSLTVSMPIFLGLQFLTIHLKSPLPLGVLHPLIGFTLFNTNATLVHRTWQLVYPKPNADNEEI
jgi:Family of unknown function (DUF6220)